MSRESGVQGSEEVTAVQVFELQGRKCPKTKCIVLRYIGRRLSGYDIIRGMEKLTLSDYQSLAELRYQIRCFLAFSEQAARAAGLEPRQHQLMLGLKGLPRGGRAH